MTMRINILGKFTINILPLVYFLFRAFDDGGSFGGLTERFNKLTLWIHQIDKDTVIYEVVTVFFRVWWG